MKLAIRLFPTPPFPWRERCTVRVLLVDCVASSINEFGGNDFCMAVFKSPVRQMSLLSSGGPDGYFHATRFCSCARKLAIGSKAGGVLSGDVEGTGMFGDAGAAGPFFPR